MLAELCRRIEEMPLSNEAIFADFDFPEDLPWAEKLTDESNCYACLRSLAASVCPKRILEIGTGFGLSAAALAAACAPLELLVTMDLGIYGEQYGYRNNIIVARQAINNTHVYFYQVDTQIAGGGGQERGILYWRCNPELARRVTTTKFDVVFIDGKHTEDGLLNDMVNFWPYLRSGGLMICDDMHDPADYPRGRFAWLGDTWYGYFYFLENVSVAEHHIWKFPFVPSGQRPLGIILK